MAIVPKYRGVDPPSESLVFVLVLAEEVNDLDECEATVTRSLNLHAALGNHGLYARGGQGEPNFLDGAGDECPPKLFVEAGFRSEQGWRNGHTARIAQQKLAKCCAKPRIDEPSVTRRLWFDVVNE